MKDQKKAALLKGAGQTSKNGGILAERAGGGGIRPST